MTAISAPLRATASPTGPANPFHEPTSAPSGRAHIRIPGSDRTYGVRDVLRGLGLRWDPVSHAWHGTLPMQEGTRLAREFGLRPQTVPTIEAFETVILRAPAPALLPSLARPPTPLQTNPSGSSHPRFSEPGTRPHDGRATHVEAPLAYRAEDEDGDADEIATPSRRFTPWETTSGLPDDSREVDERAAERALHDLRARLNVARALASATPGLSETLARDWRKAAWFYGRFAVTEAEFRRGSPRTWKGSGSDDPDQAVRSQPKVYRYNESES